MARSLTVAWVCRRLQVELYSMEPVMGQQTLVALLSAHFNLPRPLLQQACSKRKLNYSHWHNHRLRESLLAFH